MNARSDSVVSVVGAAVCPCFGRTERPIKPLSWLITAPPYGQVSRQLRVWQCGGAGIIWSK